MEKLIIHFQESMEKQGLSKKDRVLLAVSGGVDSVVLTACTAMAGWDFAIAHVNFMLRGDESNRDEEFVRTLAGKYNKPVYVQHLNAKAYAEKNKCSIQVAARELRYQWFQSLIEDDKQDFRFLLTGHNLNDNIETMMMHFFRGTGIRGLSGMPIRKNWLVRPLLEISRNRIENFALTNKLTWVEDTSNFKDDYTRNYFRNQIIPSLTTVFPELQQNLDKNLQRFSETNILYDQAIAFHKKKLIKQSGNEIHIPILLLKKAVPVKSVLFEIINDYHFTAAQTDDIIRMMDGVNGKYIASSTHRIIKNRGWLIIAVKEDRQSSHIIINEMDSLISYPNGTIQFKEFENIEKIYTDPPMKTEYVNAELIQYPLILRKWKTGDYFYPLGMNKKKKISRFLIDQKLSKTAKENIWVLIQGLQIIYVVGMRIDNRFAIKNANQKALKITVSEKNKE